MTEQEAKTKWCPMVQKQAPDGMVYQGRCIATECMMWRWDSIPNPDYKPMQWMATFPPDDTPTTIKSTTNGHCGLANHP